MKKIICQLILAFPLLAFAQFDGIVGTDGCKAIHCNDLRIIEWAINCEVTRGYQDIKVRNARASFGQENDVLGKVEDGNTTKAISLGDSGIAVLSFQTPIVNGAGYDFVVFENSLNDRFLELAFVEVSSDGVNYFRFPATSNTQTETQIGNSGGIDATEINNLAGKYKVGWGTPFDLDDLPDDVNLDKNNITHVKLIDVIGSIEPQYASLDFYGNMINDPYPTAFASGGFDLTGIGVINNRNNVFISQYQEFAVSVYPNPCKNFVYVHAKDCNLSLYNSLGQKLYQQQLTENTFQVDMSNYLQGVYFLYLQNNKTRKCVKIVKQ